MPIDDWQFWVVTLAAALGFFQLLRTLRPTRDGAPCPSCATGTAACAKPAPQGPRLVQLGRDRA
jgi:hypothetical protein